MKYIITILVIATILLSGCTYTDVNSPTEYHRKAWDYTLPLDGWNITNEKTSSEDYDGMESSWVIEAVRGNTDVKLTVIVFGSTSKCMKTMTAHRADTQDISDTLDYDDGYYSTKFGHSIVVERKQNVMWEIKGNLDVEEAKELSGMQKGEIK